MGVSSTRSTLWIIYWWVSYTRRKGVYIAWTGEC
nr:MAG TPA: hypothetical protein [Caudoviricetes sp.]